MPLCSPGTVISLVGGGSGSDLAGVATLNGITYSPVGGAGGVNLVSFDFRTMAVAPPLGSSEQVLLSAPFTFNGFYNLGGTNTLTGTLTGSGLAFLNLHRPTGADPQSIGDGWIFTGGRLEFGGAASTVTPEPGTLILLGSGLVTAVAARRRRKS